MMDSFEFSKIAAAVLMALLVIVGARTYLNSRHPHYDANAGYTLPAPPAEEAAAAAPAAGAPAPAADAGAAAPAAGATAPAAGAAAPAEAAAQFNPAEVVALLAAAKPDAGKKAFGVCLSCHTADAAAASKAGPNLWNVVNRKLGSREDFSGYSPGMKAKGGEWSYEHLAGFLHNPKGYLPGTKMGFKGIAKPQELADVIAYIRTLADTPAPLPH